MATSKMWTTVASSLGLRVERRVVASSLYHRSFASQTKKKKKSSSTEQQQHPPESYFDRKQAAKQVRTDSYNLKLAKIETEKHRRDDSPANNGEFKEWWKQKIVSEHILDRKARQAGKEWNIKVAAVLERIPVVLPDKHDWEKEYDEHRAYLAQFGKEYPKEFSASSPRVHVPITDEELLDALPEGYRPAPRVTHADETGDVQTFDRKLKDRVFFTLVDQDTGNCYFPTVDLTLSAAAAEDEEQQESLFEAAQRALQETLKTKLELYCPSQAPMAVELTTNDAEDPRYFGTKTFYMRFQYDDGTIAETNTEFAWLDRKEIVERVQQHQGDDESKFYRYLL